jgi:predicted anti-sigma-YlaC factor YlaD
MIDMWNDRLSEYLDGELSETERAEAEAHLRHCTACRSLLAELKAVVAWLAADTPDNLEPSTFEPIRSTVVAQRQPRWPMIVPWAAAAMLAVIAGSLWIARPEPVPMTIYQRAIADLEQVVQDGGATLDPQTRRKIEDSIALIDRAIEQSERALTRDSTNEFVSRHLVKLKDAKLAALRDAVTVVRGQL